MFAVKADVSKEEEVKALVDFALEKFGRLDVMVRQTLGDATSLLKIADNASV